MARFISWKGNWFSPVPVCCFVFNFDSGGTGLSASVWALYSLIRLCFSLGVVIMFDPSLVLCVDSGARATRKEEGRGGGIQYVLEIRFVLHKQCI